MRRNAGPAAVQIVCAAGSDREDAKRKYSNTIYNHNKLTPYFSFILIQSMVAMARTTTQQIVSSIQDIPTYLFSSTAWLLLHIPCSFLLQLLKTSMDQ